MFQYAFQSCLRIMLNPLLLRVVFLLIASNLVHFTTAVDCQGRPKTREGQLRQYLFCDYERLLPPVLHHTTTLILYDFRLSIRSFDFRENSGTLNLYAWLSMRWKDEHLSWDPNIYDEITRITVDSGDIWLPDIYLDQSKNGNLLTRASSVNCWSFSNGTITCTIPITLNVLCEANYKNWPHDTQKCRLNFLTWSYLREQVDFDSDSIKFETKSLHENMNWRIIDTIVIGRWLTEWDDVSSNVGVEFDFVIQRISDQPAVVYFIPTLTLCAMNFVTMILKLESKARLILASINTLLQFLLAHQHAWYAPYHTDSIPIVFSFFQHSYLITILVIVETVVLARIKKFDVTLAQWMFLEKISMTKISILLTDIEFRIKDTKQMPEKPDTIWIIFIKIVDRCLMLVMIGSYCFMFKELLPSNTNE